MSDLCTGADVSQYLGLSPSQDSDLIQKMIDRLDRLIATLTGQLYLKATTNTPVTAELSNGTGRIWTWAQRPIATLTTVLIGQNLAIPDETLTVADPTVIVVDPKRPRRIQRTDGSIFPAALRNVSISYIPADNVPADIAMALIEGVAFLYRRRGSEDAKSESISGFSHTLQNELRECPAWMAVIDRKRKPAFGMVGNSGGPVVPGSLWPYGLRFTGLM